MRMLGLDIGDAWTGSALSDALGITVRPYKTIASNQLITFLDDIFEQEEIETIVIGYPKTMRGTESAQTKKIVEQKTALEKQFSTKKWILWDERLSSKRAAHFQKGISKEAKLRTHSIAAAFILESYLNYISTK